MAVTINDIALLAKVNASTVSRALRGDPKVRRETRELICKLAEEMAYIPNRGARQLAGGKTGVVALLAGSLSFEYLPLAATALNQELTEYGYLVTVLPESHAQERFLQTLRLFEQRFCDAAVLFSPPAQKDDLPEFQHLQKMNFPIVCIDQWLKNYPFPGITNDAEKSIALLGEKMLSHHIKAAVVHFPEENSVALFRRAMAEKFLQRHNIPYVLDLKEIPELLKRYPKAGLGIFANNPNLPELNDVFAENPPAMCIGGMFDSWRLMAPKYFDAIYLCMQDAETVGKLAAEYIVRMLRGDDTIEPLTLIPPKEIVESYLKS